MPYIVNNIKYYDVLNLGAGIQSTTVLLMIKHGILPKVDYAIFADTGWEPKAVYEHLKWLENELNGIIKIAKVTAGDLRKDIITAINNKTTDRVSMPMFLLNEDKSQGLASRHCTKNYKILPITKFIRTNIFKLKPYQHFPKDIKIRQWFGISSDEMRRVRISKDFWSENIYPLINLPDKFLTRSFSRQDCIEWLNNNYPNRNIPRSACIACPFHTNKEWRSMKNNNKEEFKDAVEFEKFVQENDYGYHAKPFLHRKLITLDKINFDKMHEEEIQKAITPADILKQIDKEMKENTWVNECEGTCGV